MFLTVLSCSYGGGHRRVAEVIAEEWTAQVGGRVEVIDYFTRFAGPRFAATTRFWYYQTVRFAPKIQERYYNYMGTIPHDSRFRRAVNRTGMENLVRHLDAARPDVVCGVHWTFAGTLSDLKAAGRTAVPCLTVITDYVSHGEWLHPHMDRYAVAHPEMREGLLAHGVPAERIIVSGMPVARKFGPSLDRAHLMARLGLTPGVPVVLAMAGADAAVGRLGDVVAVLARFPRPVQALVVCANAPRLVDQVRRLTARSAHRFHVLGFVANVEELMAVGDVLITKAGGVTVSEALVKRLPMLLYGSIPGHETSNTRFLVEHGAALEAATPAELHGRLDDLLAHPERLAAMREAAARLARPDAARVVVTHLARLASEADPARRDSLAATAPASP
jgi:processive 1,2-diacylglycerol beta-glucosyltransferase